MMEKYYEIGYDITGRRILLDESNNIITYVPDDLTEEEVLFQIDKGEFILIQSKYPKINTTIAPKEDWPINYSWNELKKRTKKEEEVIPFQAFAEVFKRANLTPEQEWEIIMAWKSYQLNNHNPKMTLERFRISCMNLYNHDSFKR